MRSFLLVLGGLTVMRSMMMLSTTVFLPLYLTETGSSIWLAGAALSIVEAAGVAGALAGGWISDQKGRIVLVHPEMRSLLFFVGGDLHHAGRARGVGVFDMLLTDDGEAPAMRTEASPAGYSP